MNRLGWAMLLLIAGVIGGFWWLQGRGGEVAETPPSVAPPPPAADGGRLRIPVADVAPAALADSFTDGRGGDTRAHGAIDIMAPRGTPVLAAMGGRIEKLFDSRLGGRTIYVRSGDGATVTYYAHLDTYAIGLSDGQVVRAGQQIGTVGSTGDADPAAPHLHFEVKRMAPGEAWYQGRAINPFPLLAGKAAPG